jgi:hypothetical protein
MMRSPGERDIGRGVFELRRSGHRVRALRPPW